MYNYIEQGNIKFFYRGTLYSRILLYKFNKNNLTL